MAGEKRRISRKTFKVGKDLDVSAAGSLKGKLAKAARQVGVDLVLDMKEVGKIDSMGLGMIIAARNSVTAGNGRLILINLSGNLSALFKRMHLDMSFEFQEAE